MFIPAKRQIDPKPKVFVLVNDAKDRDEVAQKLKAQ
jgi:hypothetical protein